MEVDKVTCEVIEFYDSDDELSFIEADNKSETISILNDERQGIRIYKEFLKQLMPHFQNWIDNGTMVIENKK